MATHTGRASYDTSRRTFRGRGGPTDRRLPKHNAARRKPNSLGQGDGVVKANKKYDSPPAHLIAADKSTTTIAIKTEEPEISTYRQSFEEVTANPELKPSAVELEIKHVLRRTRNVQESIRLSKTAIANPITWERNVLNPAMNCINEWRSIIRHHFAGAHDDEDVDQLAVSQQQQEGTILNYEENRKGDEVMARAKEAGLEVYVLVQLAMQSGPLSGAKPGYFKRCGGDVARKALQFLHDLGPLLHELHWSEKQIASVKTWKSNAERAVAADKPPSKSVLKKQDKAEKGRKQKRRKPS